MNKKVLYIVDYLGIHCGMRYYNEAFVKVLMSIDELEIVILSNYRYGTQKKPFFYNQYTGTIVAKTSHLLINYSRLFFFILKHRHSIFIFLSYGITIDVLFIYIITIAQNHVIDVHEAVAQSLDKSKLLKKCFHYLYSKRVNRVIEHSERTDKYLNEYNYRGVRFFVPHFRYCIKTEYDMHKVGTDVLSSVKSDKINFLFFGNICYNKGIDVLIDSINQLPESITDRINVIVAGKDYDGVINRNGLIKNNLLCVILRHIEDDELVYLFKHTDYVTLPYRKTSQSGILEMAFHFKKPVVVSDIPYFRQTLMAFPSFGILAKSGVLGYADAIESIVNNSRCSFFEEADNEKYNHRKEIDSFKNRFGKWIME
jgi:glycosyltransferase involved in cell wall biosynthesis